jgi:copper ion binding protein
MEQKTLKVTGMSCEHCVKAVSNALKALPGLDNIQVDLKNGTASFGYDPAQTPLETIKAAIVEEGYEVA